MALTSAHEYARQGQQLSVEHLWANAAARGGVVASGARLAVLRTAAVLDGQCADRVWPYDPATATPRPAGTLGDLFVIANASQLLAPSLGALRGELVASRPAMLVINPNDAFLRGVSPIPATAVEVGDAFLHAVLAVGYDDRRAVLTVRNSWGTGWGDAGYADLTYDFVTLRARRLMTVTI